MTTLSLLLGAGILLFVWVHWVEPHWFHLRYQTVRVKKSLPKPLAILHLSDLHFTGPRKILGAFFDRLAKLDLDFVFVTGDLVDHPQGIGACIANLKKLKPRRGIYAVFGNHDYEAYPFREQVQRLITGKKYGHEWPKSEVEAMKKALEEAGIRLLINQNISVELGQGEGVKVIGIDDPFTRHANLPEAFQGIHENGKLHLVLVHSPAIYPALAQCAIDVAFSGHTHGGQVRLPGLGAVPLVAGRLEPIIDSTDRYGFFGLVSRGMGASPAIRLRFFCRPEAVLVRIEGESSL